jgi:hypothetical protein
LATAGSPTQTTQRYAVWTAPTNDDSALNSTTANVTIQGYRQTIISFAPTLTWYETTLGPRPGTTDSRATTTKQTVESGNRNTSRIALNTQVRAENKGVAGYFDLADGAETYRNSGLIKASSLFPTPATISDCIHPNDAGAAYDQQMINPWGDLEMTPSPWAVRRILGKSRCQRGSVEGCIRWQSVPSTISQLQRGLPVYPQAREPRTEGWQIFIWELVPCGERGHRYTARRPSALPVLPPTPSRS